MVISRRTLAIATAGAAFSLVAGAIALAAIDLPTQASDQASEATAEVALPASATAEHGASSEAPSVQTEGSPNAAAAFGQCVAENAKTASENGGQDWNPTDGCENTNRNASANGGASIAESKASDHASAGLERASEAGANGDSHRAGR